VNPPNEMNPITWTLIVEESETDTPIPRRRITMSAAYWGSTRLAQRGGEAEMGSPVKLGRQLAVAAEGHAKTARQGTILSMRRIVEGTTSTRWHHLGAHLLLERPGLPAGAPAASCV
jgi:hypothetical protein